MTCTLVTGATGNMGSAVVAALQARGQPVRAAGRSLESIARVCGADVPAVVFDFHDPATWRGALEGVTTLLLVRPPAIADVQRNLNPFVDLAYERGVTHVVFLSVAGADKNRFVPHAKVEAHLQACGDRYTNLRPGFFAQNLETAYLRDIVEDDRIYVPAGRRQPVNWIDVADIAEVAAVVLADPSAHQGASYTLAGPGAISWREVVGVLSRELGREIRYVPASVLGYVWHLHKRGLPFGAIVVQTVLHVLLRFAQGATEDPTLARLLGRPGGSLAAYVARRRRRFLPETQG